MSALPILKRLPGDYSVVESPGGVVAVRRELADAFARAGYGPDHVGPLKPSDLAGRKPLFELRIDAERYVVRRFSHGGLLRWLTGARFLDAERPFRELVLADRLTRAGFQTPQVAAARARRSKAGGWRLDLVTRRVEGSANVAQALEQLGRPAVGGAARRSLLTATGDLVRRMHDAGFLHADLTTSNLLQRAPGSPRDSGDPGDSGGGPDASLMILDLDRSEFRDGPLSDPSRVSNIARLLRHVERRRAGGQLPVLISDYARFLVAYEPRRSTRRELWARIRSAHAKLLGLHAVGWAAERRLAGH